MKNNLINHYNNKRISQNNNNKNYNRCASVEERYNNNPHFTHNLEKEFLNVKFLVKNSVEKINTLFNNEEFKQKTISNKINNNPSKKININRCDLNKECIMEENTNKKDSKTNSFKFFFNSPREKKNIFSRYSVNEEDELINNSNEMFNELKELNNNNKNYSIKGPNSNENDSINISLLNLQSNKLYRNKEKKFNLKRINFSENTNSTIRNKNNNKNLFISNQLKIENQNDIIDFKDKKKDILKYIQKGNNKTKKSNKINNDLKTRNINNPKIYLEKNNPEEENKFNNTLKLKNLNKSLQKENNSRKKHYSNKMITDLKFNINTDNSYINMNNNIEKQEKKEDNTLLYSFDKHLSEMQNKKLSNKEYGKNDNEKKNKKKYFNGIKKKNNLKNDQSNKILNNTKKPTNKIKTQEFLKMMLLLNEYLINNNLFEDYSFQENKKILDNYSLFLAKNINTNNLESKENNINDKKIMSTIIIQRKWRKQKIEKYLTNNFIEEETELKKMLINNIIQKPNFINNQIIDIFKTIINKSKLFDNNSDDLDKIFYQIQKIIKRNLTINEKNLLYKEYINKVICNK